MRTPKPLQSATALCLLVLLGALGTGVPSHSHADHGAAAERQSHALSPDQHSHGMQLVEQDDRAVSAGPQLAELPLVAMAAVPAVIVAVSSPETNVLRPMERAPPPGAPRAPPSAV